MAKSYRAFFWNVERFFDVRGGPVARSLGATSAENWDQAAYDAKLRNVCAVLSRMTANAELAFGAFCEVESKKILDDIKRKMGWADLVNLDDHSDLRNLDGCDVALLYSSKIFKTKPIKVRSVSLNNQFATRDILEVELELKGSGSRVNLLIVHWPSRLISEGETLRLAHAYYLKNLIDQTLQLRREHLVDQTGKVKMPAADLLKERWGRPLLSLGDFNDEPFDKSIRQVLETRRTTGPVTRNASLSDNALKNADTYLRRKVKLFNPCWSLIDTERAVGTFYREGTWRIYDQVIASHGAIASGSPFRLKPDSVSVFREESIQYEGATVEVTSRNGLPKGFSRQTRQGVSDHLPITFNVEVDD